jgi:lipopolysaccharide exporter
LDTPSALAYVPGLCVAMAFDRVAVLPERLMSRRMQFRRIALSRAAAETTYAAVAVLFAIAGYHGMSIIYANIARFGLLAVVMYCFVSVRDLYSPTRLRWTITRRIFWFGGPLSLDELSHFASRQWDNLLMGRFFGDAVTGNYNLAYNLADIPAAHIGEHIGDVLLPSFSKMTGDRRRWALLRATGFLAIIVFPMAIGLAVVAPTLTETVFDPRWNLVGPMLTLLAGLSIVRPIGWTMTSYLQSLSETRVLMVLGIVRLVILLTALCALKSMGPLWACMAAGLAYSIHAIGAMWVVSKKDGVGIGQMLAQLWAPIAACLPMVLMVLTVRYIMTSGGWSPGWVMLGCEILTGCVVYILAMRIISRVLFESVLTQLAGISSRRSSENGDP